MSDPILRRAAGERCVDGTLYRHNPSRDDPYYEHNLGCCPDCGGEGRNCTDCAAEHAEERWEMRTHGERVVVLHLCADCADRRRDAMAEVTP